MATFGERFKELRIEKKLTQDKLAEKFFIQKSSISKYENNVHIPEIDILQKFADFFGVSIDYLLGRSDYRYDLPKGAHVPENIVYLPILGVVRAGEPLYAEQNIIGYFPADPKLIPPGECFYLRVIGDSMNLSHIVDGQLVLIRRQEEVENGEIALVIVNGDEATIKKFYKTGNVVTLMPNSSNPEHQPKVIDLKTTELHVIGKVVGSFISMR